MARIRVCYYSFNGEETVNTAVPEAVRLLLAILLAVVLLVTVACGSDSDGTPHGP
jgi:hypothetical protein